MLDHRVWKGLWHDSRDPDAEVAGELSFSQADSELMLIGRLPVFSDEPTAPWNLVDRPRICGITTDGDAITLERCIPRSATAGRGVPVERHHADVILVGACYELNEEIVFDAIEFQFTHLDQWATVSGFHSSWNWREDGKTIDSLSVTFTPPGSITATLDDGTTLSIDFGWSTSGLRQVTTESIIKQHATVSVRFASPTPFSDAIAIGGQLRNFLNLAVGAAVHPRKIVGVIDPPADAEADSLTGLTPGPLRIEVLYGLSDQPEAKDLEDAREPFKMTFTLADVADTLGGRFGGWRDNYKRLKPTFDLFFAVNYGAMRYIDPQFLALVQAIETYDRRTNGDSFPDWVSDEDRRGHREPTLRMRLGRIYQLMGTVAARIAGDSESFIASVVDARNYYTHYDERLEQKAPKGIELVPLTAQLKALTEALLLSELRFSIDEIDSMFSRVDRYRSIEHLNTVVAEHVASRVG